MKLHLECERTIHFQKVDGTQGVLKEGAQAYMRSKRNAQAYCGCYAAGG